MVRIQETGISTPGVVDGLEVSFTVEGDDEGAANKLTVDLKDRVVRVLRALEDSEQPDHPDECEGYLMAVDWERYAAAAGGDE